MRPVSSIFLFAFALVVLPGASGHATELSSIPLPDVDSAISVDLPVLRVPERLPSTQKFCVAPTHHESKWDADAWGDRVFDGLVADIPTADTGTVDYYYHADSGDVILSVGSGLALFGIDNTGGSDTTWDRSQLSLEHHLGPAQNDSGGIAWLDFSASLPSGVFNLGPLLDADSSVIDGATFDARFDNLFGQFAAPGNAQFAPFMVLAPEFPTHNPDLELNVEGIAIEHEDCPVIDNGNQLLIEDDPADTLAGNASSDHGPNTNVRLDEFPPLPEWSFDDEFIANLPGYLIDRVSVDSISLDRPQYLDASAFTLIDSTVSEVPEPACGVIVTLAAGAMFAVRRRKNWVNYSAL